MHELAITQSVVDAVCERAAGRTVHAVTVRVGALTAVVPEAMLFCFELATEDTVMAGASLVIDRCAAVVHCHDCGVDFEPPDLILLCPCGSADVAVTAGRELQIVSMEVG
jgi:hydrogenase nickel incorporation protein HypA/HybF